MSPAPRGRRRRRAALHWALAGLMALWLWLPAEGTESAGGPLTTETLGNLLRTLGYDPEVIESASGGVWGFRILARQDRQTFTIEVQVSSDQQRILVIAPLGKVADPAGLPAARLLRLLEENARIGPASFSFVRPSINLNLPLPNRGLTAARFRNHLQTMLATIVRTEPLWDPAKWSSEEGAARGRGRPGVK